MINNHKKGMCTRKISCRLLVTISDRSVYVYAVDTSLPRHPPKKILKIKIDYLLS